ncbi:hypothetical protein [Bradyrhizobium sp.]|uniref:hypothetical protein n=1 Tax=Bradyrhizobium sp. TaxID=376 RepID=UPI000ADCD02B|nr:hypothetical protein [Bradyrhizobium sp.]
MAYSLVIAGLDTRLFDRIKKISEKRLAPHGKLIVSPVKGYVPYTDAYIEGLLSSTHESARKQDGADGTPTLLMYIDYGDHSTKRLLDAFFPFSLPFSLQPVDFSLARNKPQESELLNAFAGEVDDSAIELRRLSSIVSEYTAVANLTPLLLPLGNFRSSHLRAILEQLYSELANSDDPKALITASVKKFFDVHPRTHYGSEPRHCFSDGYLFFRSPGKNRHGFFRHAPESTHAWACLLNARSRIGGRYAAKFHYDCVPVSGALAGQYENCHRIETTPNSREYVNIAPNDYIR